jgi:glycosyltransferase involved in cell wall biosynthesis
MSLSPMVHERARAPRVSIGMPVYNDEPFVAAAVEGVLAQDFPDLELIISDNASTDRSAEICESYARMDSRVRLFIQPQNRGAVWNFRHVLGQSRGEYFAWTGGHDLMQPAFASSCADVLCSRPDVALAYPSVRYIGRDGLPLTSAPPAENIDTCADGIRQRVRRTILELYSCHMLYGMFRREVLNRCRHGIICRGPDHVLLMEVALHGAFANIPEQLLHLRENRGPGDQGASYDDYMRGQLLRLDPDAFRKGKLRPHWRWGWEHLRGLLAADIPVASKAQLAPVIANAFWHRWRPYLSQEVFRPLAER